MTRIVQSKRWLPCMLLLACWIIAGAPAHGQQQTSRAILEVLFQQRPAAGIRQQANQTFPAVWSQLRPIDRPVLVQTAERLHQRGLLDVSLTTVAGNLRSRTENDARGARAALAVAQRLAARPDTQRIRFEEKRVWSGPNARLEQIARSLPGAENRRVDVVCMVAGTRVEIEVKNREAENQRIAVRSDERSRIAHDLIFHLENGWTGLRWLFHPPEGMTSDRNLRNNMLAPIRQAFLDEFKKLYGSHEAIRDACESKGWASLEMALQALQDQLERGCLVNFTDDFRMPHDGPPGSGSPPSNVPEEAQQEHAAHQMRINEKLAALQRAERHTASLEGEGISGGVILGNKIDPASGKVVEAKFIWEPGDYAIELLVESPTGKRTKCRYLDVDPTDLWCAYHIVQPTAVMREQYKVPPAECNLVSCRPTGGTGAMRFAVHPALVDTHLAAAAMWLDALMLDPYEKCLPVNREKLVSLQWFDAPAGMRIKGDNLTVEPLNQPADLILRLRFFGMARPPQLMQTRIGEWGKDMLEAVLKRPTLPGFIGRHTWDECAMLAERQWINRHGRELPFAADKVLPKLKRDYPCVRVMDRFARTLAVLNWIADSQNGRLPLLPTEIMPQKAATPTRLRYVDFPSIRLPLTPQLPGEISGDSKKMSQRWYIGMHQGKKIGYQLATTRTFVKAGEPLIETILVTELQLLRGGDLVEMKEELVQLSKPNGSLVEFHLAVTSNSQPEPRWVRGRLEKDLLILEEVEKKVVRMNWKEDGGESYQLFNGLADQLPLKLRTPGNQESRLVADFLNGKTGVQKLRAESWEEIELVGRREKLLRIKRTIEDHEELLWIDASGFVRKKKHFGIEWIAATREQANRANDRFDSVEIARVDYPPPDVGRLDRLRLRLTMSKEENSPKLPTTPHQRVKTLPGGGIEVDLNAQDFRNPKPAPAVPLSDVDRRRYLQPTLHLDFEDQAIQSLVKYFAKQDVRKTLLSLEGSLRLTIGKDYSSLQHPQASKVLTVNKSDCRGVATLLAALARGIGVPSRIALGWVYVPGDLGFAGHAWTEVWIDGQWRALDGTTGNGGISAAYLKEFDIADWSEYAAYYKKQNPLDLNRLRIEVIAAQSIADPAQRQPLDLLWKHRKLERAPVNGRTTAMVQREAVAYAEKLAMVGSLHLQQKSEKTIKEARAEADQLAHRLNITPRDPCWPLQGVNYVDQLNLWYALMIRLEPSLHQDFAQRYDQRTAKLFSFALRVRLLIELAETPLIGELKRSTDELLRALAKELNRPALVEPLFVGGLMPSSLHLPQFRQVWELLQKDLADN